LLSAFCVRGFSQFALAVYGFRQHPGALRQRQIASELNKGFEQAARYEELRLRLDALNQELTSAGLEIEASPELSNLDEEAFRPVEPGVSVYQILSLAVQSAGTDEEKAVALNPRGICSHRSRQRDNRALEINRGEGFW
jgi:hypothetical protein